MIILDNFLDNDELTLFCDDRNWKKSLDYTWVDRDCYDENCIWEHILEKIWRPMRPLMASFDGIEYWTNILSPTGSKDLDWHVDKDEKLYEEHNDIKSPVIGSVLYGHTETPGDGNLELIHQEMLERIEPLPNRLIIFDSSQYHRVAPVTKGFRRTFASNIWEHKPDAGNYPPKSSSRF